MSDLNSGAIHVQIPPHSASSTTQNSSAGVSPSDNSSETSIVAGNGNNSNDFNDYSALVYSASGKSTHPHLTPPYSPSPSQLIGHQNGVSPTGGIPNNSGVGGAHHAILMHQLFPSPNQTPYKRTTVSAEPDLEPQPLSPVHKRCSDEHTANVGLLSVCTALDRHNHRQQQQQSNQPALPNEVSHAGSHAVEHPISDQLRPPHQPITTLSPVSRGSGSDSIDLDQSSSSASNHGETSPSCTQQHAECCRLHYDMFDVMKHQLAPDRDCSVIHEDCVGQFSVARGLLIPDWSVGMTGREFEIRTQLKEIQESYRVAQKLMLRLKRCERQCNRKRKQQQRQQQQLQQQKQQHLEISTIAEKSPDNFVPGSDQDNENRPKPGLISKQQHLGPSKDLRVSTKINHQSPQKHEDQTSESPKKKKSRKSSNANEPPTPIKLPEKQGESTMNNSDWNEVLRHRRASGQESPEYFAGPVPELNLKPNKLVCNEKQRLLEELPLQADKLLSDAHVMLLEGGLFYVASLKIISADAMLYSVRKEGQRASRPYVMCQEELLINAYNEVRLSHIGLFTPGDRVCALWSGQLQAFYPGTVEETTQEKRGKDPTPSTDRHGTPLVTISFDDGDSGQIPITDVRLLPADFPFTKVTVTELPESQHSRRSSSGRTMSIDNNETSVVPAKRRSSMSSRSSGSVTSKSSAADWTWMGDVVKNPDSSSNTRASGQRSSQKQQRVHYEKVQNGANVFSVGDIVHLQHGSSNPGLSRSTDSDDTRPYVAVIRSFWTRQGASNNNNNNKKYVRVAWCYRADELRCDHKIQVQGMLPYAIFRSTHEDDNEVETISERCTTMKYDEIHQKLAIQNSKTGGNHLPGNCYFIAGDYDPVKNKLKNLAHV